MSTFIYGLRSYPEALVSQGTQTYIMYPTCGCLRLCESTSNELSVDRNLSTTEPKRHRWRAAMTGISPPKRPGEGGNKNANAPLEIVIIYRRTNHVPRSEKFEMKITRQMAVWISLDNYDDGFRKPFKCNRRLCLPFGQKCWRPDHCV